MGLLQYLNRFCRRSQGDRPRPTAHPVRPTLETLEDRSLPSVTAQFGWAMADRFGLDANGNGRIDLRNDSAYANPTAFTVRLDGRPSTTDSSIVDYRWLIDGKNLPAPRTLTGATPTADLPQGTYSVTLTVKDAAGQSGSATQAVTVRDLLIVSVGDSIASGEGAPDVTHRFGGSFFGIPVKTADAQWADDSLTNGLQDSASAHRSLKAAPAQAALQLERDDPHTSVTFLSVARSGATILDTIAQLQRVQQITQGRPIDSLTVSVGGNDAGFGECTLSLLVADRALPYGLLSNLEVLGVKVPFKSYQEHLAWTAGQVDQKLGTLPGRYKDLNTAITVLGVANVFITEYPIVTRDGNGAIPAQILGDVFPGLEMDTGECQVFEDRFLRPLNGKVHDAATLYGWNYVGGIADDFTRHGYSAPDRWVRTADDSRMTQGRYTNPDWGNIWFYDWVKTADKVLDIGGTLHPNDRGYQAIATRLVSAMQQAGRQRIASGSAVLAATAIASRSTGETLVVRAGSSNGKVTEPTVTGGTVLAAFSGGARDANRTAVRDSEVIVVQTVPSGIPQTMNGPSILRGDALDAGTHSLIARRRPRSGNQRVSLVCIDSDDTLIRPMHEAVDL